jgi:hypothetical protein
MVALITQRSVVKTHGSQRKITARRFERRLTSAPFVRAFTLAGANLNASPMVGPAIVDEPRLSKLELVFLNASRHSTIPLGGLSSGGMRRKCNSLMRLLHFRHPLHLWASPRIAKALRKSNFGTRLTVTSLWVDCRGGQLFPASQAEQNASLSSSGIDARRRFTRSAAAGCAPDACGGR